MATNAGAHKLARLLYRMLKFGKAYVESGQEAYEKLSKNALSVTSSAGLASSASTSLPWLPPHEFLRSTPNCEQFRCG